VSPIPSPSPAIEAVAAAEPAPWWGVAVIAGSFLIVGAFLTFLFARWNESTKFRRERGSRLDKEVVDRGAELITAGNKMREIALLGLNRSVSDFATLLAAQARPAIDNLSLAANKFRLVQPLSIEDVLMRYMSTTMVLFLPPFAKPGQKYAIAEQTRATQELQNALRSIEGRDPLEFKPTERDLEASTRASAETLLEEMIMEALATELAEERAEGVSNEGGDTRSAP
jgi:hypothetical protein